LAETEEVDLGCYEGLLEADTMFAEFDKLEDEMVVDYP
jgi:hypothetical protein